MIATKPRLLLAINRDDSDAFSFTPISVVRLRAYGGNPVEKVKKPFHPYPSYSFTKKVVQKIIIEGSRCGSDVGIPCSHSSLFLFALGLKDGNRRILVCFPPNCNKPHFSPNSFPSFFPSKYFLQFVAFHYILHNISEESTPIQICSKKLS